jgi:hypothetical protein
MGRPEQTNSLDVDTEQEFHSSSSGSEVDLETGERNQENKRVEVGGQSPAKNKMENPPVKDINNKDINITFWICIRLLQWLLAVCCFSFMSESPTWKEVKLNSTSTKVTSGGVVNNRTTTSIIEIKGVCGQSDTGAASCYNMINASNYLMASAILYWLFLSVQTVYQFAILREYIFVASKEFIKMQVRSDILWLFFSLTSNAAVGGAAGDDMWRVAVAMMLFISFSQIYSFYAGTQRLLIQTFQDEQAHEHKTIGSERKKRTGKKGEGAQREITEIVPSQAKENVDFSVDRVTLQATFDFPGKQGKYDFHEDRDLGFLKGDLLYGLEKKHNNEWWYGVDEDGNFGEFPCNRVVEIPAAPDTRTKRFEHSE